MALTLSSWSQLLNQCLYKDSFVGYIFFPSETRRLAGWLDPGYLFIIYQPKPVNGITGCYNVIFTYNKEGKVQLNIDQMSGIKENMELDSRVVTCMTIPLIDPRDTPENQSYIYFPKKAMIQEKRTILFCIFS